MGYAFFPPPVPTHGKLTEYFQTIVFAENYAPINPFSPPGYYIFDHTRTGPVVDGVGTMTDAAPNTTATMLGLYELNSPYAHYNPSLDSGGSGPPVHQLPVQTAPVSPTANVLPAPLSTSPLTPREQQVFNAAIRESQQPLALEDLVPFPFLIYGDGFMPTADSVAGSPSPATFSSPPSFATYILPEEVSFAKPQTQTSESEGRVTTMHRSPTTKRCA